MAEIVQGAPVCRRVPLHRRAVPYEAARCWGKQGRDQAQKAGFAAAVGASQHQRATRPEPEIETGEHQPLAAPAGEVLADQVACLRKLRQYGWPSGMSR